VLNKSSIIIMRSTCTSTILSFSAFIFADGFLHYPAPLRQKNVSATSSSGSRTSQQEIDIKIEIAKYNLLSVAASIMCIPVEVFTTPPMIDITPKTPDEIEYRDRITDVLSRGQSSADCFRIAPEEAQLVDSMMGSSEKGNLPSTYGEITALGARQLFRYMNLISSKDMYEDSKNDNGYAESDRFIFVDLGCGSGKLLLQAYMELPRLKRAFGVELASTRYDAAVRALDNLKVDAKEIRMSMTNADADLDIYEGDLFQLDLSSVTHIYVASLCFTEDMMNRLEKKVVDEGNNLQCIATLKPFKSLGNPRTKYVEMSWTKAFGNGCAVYFYDW